MLVRRPACSLVTRTGHGSKRQLSPHAQLVGVVVAIEIIDCEATVTAAGATRACAADEPLVRICIVLLTVGGGFDAREVEYYSTTANTNNNLAQVKSIIEENPAL